MMMDPVTNNQLPRPVIEVKGVWKSFKTVQAVKGISLSIKPGQYVALLGPNGAGKTTLVEMIEGIRKPDKGEIFIMDKTWKDNEMELRNLIGLSLQETYFIDKLNVGETLNLFASFFRLGRDHRDCRAGRKTKSLCGQSFRRPATATSTGHCASERSADPSAG